MFIITQNLPCEPKTTIFASIFIFYVKEQYIMTQLPSIFTYPRSN